MTSKTKIDKAGRYLSDSNRDYDEEMLELEGVFDEYRKKHLDPLTKLTLELQGWLQERGGDYYIAQRLKRKPQILRKLNRFSVRLTQLQDIGGCRIIVDDNNDVNKLFDFISGKLNDSNFAKVARVTDYREAGRDDTGYRALHIILEVSGKMLELQIRSKIQHYWSESIERTSVIYGFRLKEKEGDPLVIDYFKEFSNCLHEVEVSRQIPTKMELTLQEKREMAEAIINSASRKGQISGFINENVILSMSQMEKSKAGHFNNWILVFDWTDGNFVTWEMVSRDSDAATEAYLRYESEFPEDENKEVVMIGTSNVSNIQHTHSHYFGIDHHNTALEGMEKSIIGLSKRSKVDVGARRILMTMKNRTFWGPKKVMVATLKNHFCGNIASFDYSLDELRALDVVIGTDPISLDVRKRTVIDDLI
ncbi:RelA/SpoT domain-containing protein [Pseudogemmobacter faecipullorum]|uniref:RelA/SpoT domain-containing protein n=1 Tax=Pseudogemmobacter faecipullorum TaxID=2755041 RepID=A0ABS8CR50_9RHOB|nr:RelA/SpoT domain-containing protein [Pseudogemmobacter faecipullorum]MCB5411880.1 RelA/SpoT domain-containing protein [Pseudogemmobacter faecipullorum]